MNTFADPWVRVLADGGRESSLGVDSLDRMVTGLITNPLFMTKAGPRGYKAVASEVPEMMSAQLAPVQEALAGYVNQMEEVR
jgi:hypothetical protein